MGEDSSEKTAVLHADAIKKELDKATGLETCLVVIHGNPHNHRYFLSKPEMMIGRDPAADISIPDTNISRKHARVALANGAVTVTDVGSSNGTFHNDRKLAANDPVTLVKGDKIKIGTTILKFLPAGDVEIESYGTSESKANQDPMTGIYNKGYLLQALETEFKKAKTLRTNFSILFFDLDHFKKINDTYGHEAGDYVLKEVTGLIRTSHVRQHDVFARYGGEEFVILLQNTPARAAAEIAERIRAGVAAHAFVYEAKKLPVTCSLGVAELKPETDSGPSLLKQADQALYASKTGGRNRVTVAG